MDMFKAGRSVKKRAQVLWVFVTGARDWSANGNGGKGPVGKWGPEKTHCLGEAS